MIRIFLSVLSLSLIYCMFLLSAQPQDLLTGAGFAAGVILLFRRHLFGRKLKPLNGLWQRLVAFFPFAFMVGVDIAQGIWTVMAIVLGLRPLDRSGIVAVPIGERTENGVAVTIWAITLSPGSVLIDVDWEREVMLFHFIDAAEPDRLRHTIRNFYNRYQRGVFP